MAKSDRYSEQDLAQIAKIQTKKNARLKKRRKQNAAKKAKK